MNKNQLRILAGSLIGIVLLTVLLFLLNATALVITAYIFGLAGIGMFAFSLWRFAGADDGLFVTRAAFPLLTFRYLVINLIWSIIIVTLAHFAVWQMKNGWFIFVHLFLLGITGWKLLAADAGSDEIERVETEVKAKVAAWKSIGLEVNMLLSSADGERKKQISEIYDAIRYADPMSNENLSEIETEIKENIAELASADGDISPICRTILLKIKKRNEMCKLLK